MISPFSVFSSCFYDIAGIDYDVGSQVGVEQELAKSKAREE